MERKNNSCDISDTGMVITDAWCLFRARTYVTTVLTSLHIISEVPRIAFSMLKWSRTTNMQGGVWVRSMWRSLWLKNTLWSTGVGSRDSRTWWFLCKRRICFLTRPALNAFDNCFRCQGSHSDFWHLFDRPWVECCFWLKSSDLSKKFRHDLWRVKSVN